MANLRYYNNSAPFWDFIAGLEGKDFTNHPFFSAWGGQTNVDAAGPSNNRQPGPSNEADKDTATERDTPMDDPEEVAPEDWSPWEGNAGGWMFGGPRGFMRGGRGRGGHGRGGFGRHGHHGGPGFPHGPHGSHNGPPHGPAGEQPPPPPLDAEHHAAGPDGQHGPPPPFEAEHGPKHPHGGPGPHRGGWGGRGGRCGGRGRHGPQGWRRNGMPFDMSNLAELFQTQLFGGAAEGNERNTDNANNGDFTPAVDVFDTEASFVIHVSLPGAKKEDIAVNWDSERSEVNITGVIHRPGDEEFLKTLALDERKVGAFSRRVSLGSRANPAQVDAEGISAKLEDGILRVNVPKEDKEFDVIHKIDIE